MKLLGASSYPSRFTVPSFGQWGLSKCRYFVQVVGFFRDLFLEFLVFALEASLAQCWGGDRESSHYHRVHTFALDLSYPNKGFQKGMYPLQTSLMVCRGKCHVHHRQEFNGREVHNGRQRCLFVFEELVLCL